MKIYRGLPGFRFRANLSTLHIVLNVNGFEQAAGTGPTCTFTAPPVLGGVLQSRSSRFGGKRSVLRPKDCDTDVQVFLPLGS
jgi:hypothetical protein